jgi:hypothetical protein
MSNPTGSLAEALAQFQRNLPNVVKSETATVPTKTGGSYKYSYADLAKVSAVVLPRLGEVGLSFSAKPTLNADGKFVLAYRLLHTSGESDSGEYPLPQSGTAQEHGSAITYARRYTLCSVTGVAPDEDDDGAAASNTRTVVVDRNASPQWDPIEQDVLRAGWEAEIADATDGEALKAIGTKLQTAKRSRDLSPSTYDHLAKAGAVRKAELNGAAK